MQKDLQQIHELVSTSEKLSDEDKRLLLKAIKSAESDFEISEFKLERTEKVKRTTGILLEETIEELEQKRIAVEAQNRELEVEAALEKVRSSALAMREPADMLDICKTISMQLQTLGVKEIRNVQTAIFYKHRGTYMNYEYYAKHKKTFITETTYTNNEIHHEFAKKMMKGKGEFFVTHIKGKKVKEWIDYQKTTNVFIDRFLEEASSLNYYWYSLGPVAVGISSYVALDDEELKLFNRFRNVFALAYRRFIDIEQAEAQAKEAKIELALERVRARTMAMQSSEELAEAAYVLYQQFGLLGEDPEQFTIGIIDETKKIIEFWLTLGGNQIDHVFKAPIEEPIVLNKTYLAWKKKKKSIVIDIAGDELKAYYNYFKNLPDYKEFNDYKDNQNPEHRRVIHVAFFSKGSLSLSSTEPKPDETIQLLERFAGVLEQTYTRFLDLKQAEAQAREAQIETCLERVRSRSMAMQNSEELKEVIQVIYDQFVHLDILVEHTGFIMDYKARDDMHIWLADQNGPLSEITIPYFDSPHWNSFNEAKRKGKDFFANHLTFEEKNKFYQDLFKFIPGLPDEAKEFYLSCPGLAISTVLLENVGLYIENFSGTPYSDEENNTLMRLGKVFQQTFTRFLDLQKAEAQAKEAQIELALERIRAQATAMKESSDLLDIVVTMNAEFNALGHEAHYFWHMRWLPDTYEKAMTSGDGSRIGMVMELPRGFHENDAMLEWEQNTEPVIVVNFDVAGAIDYVDKMIRMGRFSEIDQNAPGPDDIRAMGGLTFVMARTTHGEIGYSLPGVVANPPVEDLDTLVRFASVFDLAYRRFEDLKSAEHQNRETQIELSLERVRAKAMAMHKSDDLTSTVATVFSELDRLGFKTIRCGIGIFNDLSRKVHVWTASSNGQSDLAYLSGNEILEGHPLLEGIYESWQNQVDYSYVLKGKDLKKYYKVTANSNLPVSGPDVDTQNATHYYHCAFFPAGGLYAFGESEFTNEAKHLMKRFADVFHLTFTRHLDLKQAEAQNKIIQAEHDRKTKELEEARTLQLAMLPKQLPQLPDLEIAVYMKTATEVGGDYYDFCFSDDGSLNLCLGDATGHGMKAGIMVSSMKSIFTTNAPKMDIENFFATANSGVKSMNLKRMMMGFVMLNINNNTIKMINAGMPPVFLYRKNARAVDEIIAHGMPIGAMSHSQYVVSDLSLEKNDVILLMSDGMPELQNANNEMYGYKRLRDSFQKVATKSPEEIIEYLKDEGSVWVKDNDPDDDVTFVVIKGK